MGVFREEESVNIKIGVSKECECDDSCAFMASIGGRSGSRRRGPCRAVTGRFESVPQGVF